MEQSILLELNAPQIPNNSLRQINGDIAIHLRRLLLPQHFQLLHLSTQFRPALQQQNPRIQTGRKLNPVRKSSRRQLRRNGESSRRPRSGASPRDERRPYNDVVVVEGDVRVAEFEAAEIRVLDAELGDHYYVEGRMRLGGVAEGAEGGGGQAEFGGSDF